MSTKITIGTQVQILKTELNYAAEKVGELVGYSEGGFVVRLNISVPVSGVVACSVTRNVDVWASEVKACSPQ